MNSNEKVLSLINSYNLQSIKDSNILKELEESFESLNKLESFLETNDKTKDNKWLKLTSQLTDCVIDTFSRKMKNENINKDVLIEFASKYYELY